MKGGVKMKSKKSYNKILVLFSIIVVSVLMTGCNGGAPPLINIFSANPSTINQGESSTLTWAVSDDADTVTITPGVGTVDLGGSTKRVSSSNHRLYSYCYQQCGKCHCYPYG